MTRRLIMVNICAKLFQNPFMDAKVTARTRHIPYNRLFQPLTSKYDLDLGGRDLSLAHDTSSHYGEHFCQVILKSHDRLQRYVPDTKCDGRTDRRTDGQTDGRSVFLCPPIFFEKAGDKNINQ